VSGEFRGACFGAFHDLLQLFQLILLKGYEAIFSVKVLAEVFLFSLAGGGYDYCTPSHHEELHDRGVSSPGNYK